MFRIVSIPLRVALADRKNETLAVAEQSFHGSMIALNAVVAPLLVDVPDAVEMQIVELIDLADDAPIALRFVCDDGDWPM